MGQLIITQNKATQSALKLSSGYRVTKAADDAAALSISEKMRAQIRGLSRASINAQEGINLIQTAEGAMNEIHSMLQRMNELHVQAANDTNTLEDRQKIQEEIGELTLEINRIAETTEYNTLKLLDGSLGNPDLVSSTPLKVLNGTGIGNTITLQELQNYSGLKIVYAEVTHDVDTTQTASGSATLSGYDSLKSDLKNEIVPQAVQGILNTYSNTFGYLKGSSIGIGLELYSNVSSSTLASVTMGAAVSGTDALYLTYKLSVNLATLSFDASGELTTSSRDELEITIIHEMMHALMDETLTNGMLGFDGTKFDANEEFPSWFVEGMAQASAGGCFDGNDWVKNGLFITDTTTETNISNSLNNAANCLGSETGTSEYGTGYLACMYLGYLAHGGGTVSSAGMAAGLDTVLNEIKNGTSLEDVIKNHTSYTGIADFESKFANDAASFVHELVVSVGGGTGGTGAATSRGGLTLQIGANANQSMKVYIEALTADKIGVGALDVTTQASASAGISAVHRAIQLVSEQRSLLGSYQNRLEHTVKNLDNSSENTQAAESRMRDLDIADEMVKYSTTQILLQAGQAVLAQSNKMNRGILTLLE